MSKYPLRDYQQEACDNVNMAWKNGDKDVSLVLPTGAGKTRILAEMSKVDGIVVIQAHRKELVSQIAMAVAKEGLPHRFIAQKDCVKFSTNQQMKKLGYSTYAPNADIVIASAQTLVSRHPENWFKNVTRFMSDEGHHGVRESIWGKCRDKFPNAKALWPTATPFRADGKGLGRHADGYADSIIIGPAMGDLIQRNYLSNYRLIMAETDIDLTSVMISSTTGDFTGQQLKKAMKSSNIVGDTVSSWRQYAESMLTVIFSDSVENSELLAQEFRNNGIPAESISAKNNDKERADILDRFEQRRTLVLVNCDLFGEGFDCPAIECVIMDRPTESYSLFVQQFGRALRFVPGKTALIIDKVGNVRRFLARGFPLPDVHYNWTLDARDRKSSNNDDSNTVCTNVPACGFPYPSTLSICPYCGTVPVKIIQTGPKRVEGNLRELTSEELDELRRAVVVIDRDPNAVKEGLLKSGASAIAAASAAKNVRDLNDAQRILRSTINLWAGFRQQKGIAADDAYKEFYKTYGVDVLSAQALNKREATELNNRIANSI